LNYIQFFTEFAKIAQGIDTEIRTRREGDRIRVEFLCETRENKERIKDIFLEYLSFWNQEADKIVVVFSEHSHATSVERDMMVIDLKNQVRDLQTQLEYKERLLESEKEKTKILQDFTDFTKKMSDPSKILNGPQISAGDHATFVLGGEKHSLQSSSRDYRGAVFQKYEQKQIEINALIAALTTALANEMNNTKAELAEQLETALKDGKDESLVKTIYNDIKSGLAVGSDLAQIAGTRGAVLKIMG
jgi:hypothetical protein